MSETKRERISKQEVTRLEQVVARRRQKLIDAEAHLEAARGRFAKVTTPMRERRPRLVRRKKDKADATE